MRNPHYLSREGRCKRRARMVDEIRKNGTPVKKVAEKFEVTKGTVYTACRELRYNLKRNNKGGYCPFESLRMLWEEKGRGEIAETLGCPNYVVGELEKRAREAGVL